MTDSGFLNIYRPQRSSEGDVFTGVCLSTGGGGYLPQCMLGYPLWEQTPPRSRHPPELTSPKEQTPPWSRHHPGADTTRSRHIPGADTPQGARVFYPCFQGFVEGRSLLVVYGFYFSPTLPSGPPWNEGHRPRVRHETSVLKVLAPGTTRTLLLFKFY